MGLGGLRPFCFAPCKHINLLKGWSPWVYEHLLQKIRLTRKRGTQSKKRMAHFQKQRHVPHLVPTQHPVTFFNP